MGRGYNLLVHCVCACEVPQNYARLHSERLDLCQCGVCFCFGVGRVVVKSHIDTLFRQSDRDLHLGQIRVQSRKTHKCAEVLRPSNQALSNSSSFDVPCLLQR